MATAIGYWHRQWLAIARIKFLQPLLPQFQIHSFLTKNELRLDRNFIGHNTTNTSNYHSMYDMHSCTTLQTVSMEMQCADYFHYLLTQVNASSWVMHAVRTAHVLNVCELHAASLSHKSSLEGWKLDKPNPLFILGVESLGTRLDYVWHVWILNT